MIIYFQIIALVIFIITGFGLGRWIWESHRPIDTPEQLSPILIHGISETDTKALADAVAIGITGRIAEHTRTVAFINEAASTEGIYDIRVLNRVSQPTPSLIQAAHTPEAIDIAVEFAGSKVETKGLQNIFSFDLQKRGALSISLLLEKRDGKFTGLASSSFPPNSAYGFAVPIEGSAGEIAESIAMRFIQAHYAADDSFYSALDPQDFQILWNIRKRAAEIAIRALGESATSEEDTIKKEAKGAYNEIAHLVRRYTRRSEFQKLGAYLASVSEDFEQAKTHLQLVKELSNDANEISALDQLIVALEADAGTRLAKATPVFAASDLLAEQAGISKLELSVLAEPTLKSAGVTAFANQVRSTESARTPDIVLILGAFDEFEPFADRISPLDERDYNPKDNLLSHTQNVASLIATLAPTAKIRVVKALSGNGSGTTSEVLAAINRAVAANPEIIVLPLGPFDSEAYRTSLMYAAKQSLVLVAAGNNSELLKRSKTNIPGVIYVGAASGEQREPYSNFGEGVDIFAPGSVLTFDNSGKLEWKKGTSFSVAIAAAVAANIAALEISRIAPAELEQKLLKLTISAEDGSNILKVK